MKKRIADWKIKQKDSSPSNAELPVVSKFPEYPDLPGFPNLSSKNVPRREMENALAYMTGCYTYSDADKQRLYPMIIAGTSGIGKTHFGIEVAKECKALNTNSAKLRLMTHSERKYFAKPFFISFNGLGDSIDENFDAPSSHSQTGKDGLIASTAIDLNAENAFRVRLLCRLVLDISVKEAHRIFKDSIPSLYAYSLSEILEFTCKRVRDDYSVDNETRVVILIQIDEFPLLVEYYGNNWDLLRRCVDPLRQFNYSMEIVLPYFTQTALITTAMHTSINIWKPIGLSPLTVAEMIELLFQKRTDDILREMSADDGSLLRRTLALVNGLTISVTDRSVGLFASKESVSISELCSMIWSVAGSRITGFREFFMAHEQFRIQLFRFLLTGDPVTIPEMNAVPIGKPETISPFDEFIRSATSQGQVHFISTRKTGSVILTVPYPFLISACETIFPDTGLDLPNPSSETLPFFLEKTSANILAVRLLIMSQSRFREPDLPWTVNDLFVGSNQKEALDLGDEPLARVLHTNANILWNSGVPYLDQNKDDLRTIMSEIGVHILAPNTFAFDLMVVLRNMIFLVQVKSGEEVNWSEVKRKGKSVVKALSEFEFANSILQPVLEKPSDRIFPVFLSLSSLGPVQIKKLDGWITLDGERFSEFSPAERFRSGVESVKSKTAAITLQQRKKLRRTRNSKSVC